MSTPNQNDWLAYSQFSPSESFSLSTNPLRPRKRKPMMTSGNGESSLLKAFAVVAVTEEAFSGHKGSRHCGIYGGGMTT